MKMYKILLYCLISFFSHAVREIFGIRSLIKYQYGTNMVGVLGPLKKYKI